MPQSPGLGNHIRDISKTTVYEAVLHTLGYATGYIFQLSAVAAIGSWSAFMGATITGAVALYIPLILMQKLLHACGLLSPSSADLMMAAYVLGSPLVGAALLNFGFAWTLPLLPVLICAAFGTGIHLLLLACKSASPENRQNAAPVSRVSGGASRRVPVATAGAMFMHSDPFAAPFFTNDPFDTPFFNSGLRRGDNVARGVPSTRAANLDGAVVEELDDEGNVVGRLSRQGQH